MPSHFLDEGLGAATKAAMEQMGAPPRIMTRLERYEYEKRNLECRIALLDEAIAALKANPETERIINLIDRL